MYFILHPISSLNHLAARLVTDQITLAISIIGFFVLAFSYKNSFGGALDDAVSNWAMNSKEGFIKKHAKDFAIFGNAIFHILFAVALSIIVFLARHKISIVVAILFALIFSWGLNRFLKLIYKRERPNGVQPSVIPIKRRLSYCFPSGHIMASIPIYFFSAVLLQSIVPFLPWYLIALFITYSVIMSRIYLNHHYFTDVLAGVCSGIFCLNISIWFYFFVGLI